MNYWRSLFCDSIARGGLSFNDSRADDGEWRQVVFRRMRGPADAAEDQNSEKRIIERPRVMAGNRNETRPGPFSFVQMTG